MKKKYDQKIFKDLLVLPEHIINCEILSFYNHYKYLYDCVIKEIRSRYFFEACMRQLKQYSIYDRNKNLLAFQKYALLSSLDKF